MPSAVAAADIPSTPSSADLPIKQLEPKKVNFDLYRDSLIVLHGSIGNVHNLNLLLDTGTDPTIVDKRVAERLQSKLAIAGLETIHRKVEARQTTVPSIDLGPIASRDLKVLVQDLSFLEKALGARIDALIGLDVLRPNNFVIDYRTRSITFGTGPLDSSAVGFACTPPFVEIGMMLDGRPMKLLLDTAASSLMLFRTRWPEGSNSNKVKHSTNLAGDLSREPMMLKTLLLGSLELRKQSAFLVDGREDVQREFDGLFNPALLGFRQVSFDFENGRIAWVR